MKELPKTAADLPDDARYFNVNDVPVAVFNYNTLAFDARPARWFRYTSVLSEGVEITKEQFLKLIPS